MIRYCFAVDLKDDPQVIAAYEQYHQAVWPEIIKSIKDADIKVMDIYRVANRLFMIMEVGNDFSFEKKAAMDANNEIVVQWEQMLWDYQQALPTANPGEKWVLMQQIFSL